MNPENATIATVEQDSTDKLLQLSENNLMSINGLSKQMGVAINTINDHTQRINVLEDRMTTHERTVTLTNYQSKSMFNAVHARVAKLLHGIDDADYGGFCRKLWTDAKKHSKMAQTYQFTLRIDYDEVMGYIDSWYPESYSGVEGYKAHLREVRGANSNG